MNQFLISLLYKIFFFILNIVSLILTFVNIPHNTIRQLDNNKAKYLINSYKYTQVVYVSMLLINGLYIFYTQFYLKEEIKFTAVILFTSLTLLFLMTKFILISIIYFKYHDKIRKKNHKQLNKRMVNFVRMAFFINLAVISYFLLITY